MITLSDLLAALANNTTASITLLDSADNKIITFNAAGYEAVEGDITARKVKSIKVASAQSISINPKDTDAMNLYERVKRGDVSQCSFGFEIIREDTEIGEDGSVHWTIQEVRLYEVSCCTFPAYENTNISAREEQRKEILKRETEAWRAKMKGRLKNGTESNHAEKED